MLILLNAWGLSLVVLYNVSNWFLNVNWLSTINYQLWDSAGLLFDILYLYLIYISVKGCLGVLSRAINWKFLCIRFHRIFFNYLNKVTMSYFRSSKIFLGHCFNYIWHNAIYSWNIQKFANVCSFIKKKDH